MFSVAKIGLFSNIANLCMKFLYQKVRSIDKNTTFALIAYPDHQTNVANKPCPIAAPYPQDRGST